MKSQLSDLAWAGTDESVGTFLSKRWGWMLSALVLGACFAVWVYGKSNLPQLYPEPVVGNLAWTFNSKSRDYATLFALVGAFLAVFGCIWGLAGRLNRRVGVGAEAHLTDLLLLLCAPAGLWLASLLTLKRDDLWFLGISGVGIAAALVYGFLLQLRGRDFWQEDSAAYFRVLYKSLLSLAMAGLAVVAVCLLISRAGTVVPWATMSGAHAFRATAIGVAIAAVMLVTVIMVARTVRGLEAALDGAIALSQAFHAAFWLVLLPPLWIEGDRLVQGFPVGRAVYVAIAAGVLATWVTAFLRWRAVRRGPETSDVFQLVSLPTIAAVLMFFHALPGGIPVVSSDDYHFGEMVVPWWSLAQHHLIPFWEYEPARGLMNYLPGAVSSLFFDGTAATFSAGTSYLYLIVVIVILPVLARSIGRGPALVALLLAPGANGLSEIDLVVTAFLCLMAAGYLRWGPVRWLMISYWCAVALLLYAPGQGALAMIAVFPLVIGALYRGWTTARRPLLRGLGATLVASALLAALTPIGKMVFGAIRYGAEQSAVNSVAHSIGWSDSFGKFDVNPWLFEISRASWLIVAMLAGLLVMKELTAQSVERRRRVFAYALPILILTVLYIIRAAGRIDAAAATRLGFASIWALSLLLPVLIFAVIRPRMTGVAVFGWVSAAGLIFPAFSGMDMNFAYSFDAHASPRGTPVFVEGRAIEMPKLGNAVFDEKHVKRLVKVKRVLDGALDPGETYLDLTGRHATYFYFDRAPAMEAGSVYNLVTEKQQQRAVATLTRKPPPLILIAGDNILFDGGPASLRSNLLYRHVVLELDYKVVKTGDLVWLVRPDRISRMKSDDGAVAVFDNTEAPSNPLIGVFHTPELGFVPASWGRSAASLERRMRPIHRLADDMTPVPNDAVREPSGFYRVTGGKPSLSFDISSWKLAGKQAGILGFDLACENGGAAPALTVRWGTAAQPASAMDAVRFSGVNGRLLVPLDASPGWLLASEIRTLRFEVEPTPTCQAFRISNAALLQRHGAKP